MPDTPSSPSNLSLALRGLCPRCHQGKAFRNPLEFHAACPACGFELAKHDNGDGPIFFVIVIVGFLATGLAALVEYHYTPPFWLHLLLWFPFILLASIGLLRIFKAWMLGAQLTHGLLDERDHD